MWSSPPGNFHGSALVRLRPNDPPAPLLSLVAGVALHEVVSAFLTPMPGSLALKWPNDLLHNGAKLAGILLERSGDAVVMGIGVNLAYHPDLPDRPTTSLAAQGAAVSVAIFAETLAEAVARWLDRWRGGGVDAIRAAWLACAHPVGTAIRLHEPGGAEVAGLFEGLDAHGALILRLADGRMRVIHAGDVFLL